MRRPSQHPDVIFINALRECLGIAPLWGERRRTTEERFYVAPRELPTKPRGQSFGS